MAVIHIVALHAFHGRALVRWAEMTLLAWRCRMQTNQRKACQIVIEKDSSAPVFFIVASGAVLTLLPLVHIVLPVTVDAISSKPFALGFWTSMATLAGNPRMLPVECELCCAVMVE